MPTPCDLNMTRNKPSEFLSREDELALAQAWRDRGDKRARDRLVLAHAPMLRNLARRLALYGQPVEDLVQDGMVALLRASDAFDPDRGVRFAHFARNYVLEDMTKKVRDLRGIVRVPFSSLDRSALPHFQKAKAERERARGKALDDEGLKEVAQEIGVSLRTATKLEDWFQIRSAHLDNNEEDGTPGLGSRLASGAPSAEEIVAEREAFDLVIGSLTKTIRSLPDRQRAVVAEVLVTKADGAVVSVANKLGISHQRASQIRSAAFAFMRRKLDPVRKEVGGLDRLLAILQAAENNPLEDCAGTAIPGRD